MRAWASLRALPRMVWLLGIVSLANDTASDMIYPLIPLYLTAVLMAGPRALGLIEGVAEAASSLLKLFAGIAADRTRSTRGWIIGGYAVSGLARPLIALAQAWPGVLLCRLADRAGKGLRSAPRDALLSLSIQPHQRGLAFGVHRAMDNAGAVVGPLIAAALLAAGLSLRSIFLWSVVPAIIVFLLTLYLKEPANDAPLTRTPMRWTLAGLPPTFRRYLVVLGLFTLGNSSNMFLLLRAESLGVTAEHIVLMWVLFSAVAMLLSAPLSALSDHFNRFHILGIGWGAYAAAYLFIGMLPNASWTLWLAFAAYGVVTAALEGTEKALVADLVEGKRSGTAFGWYNLVAGIMLLPASLIFGWLWQTFSEQLAFGFGALCAAVAAVLLLMWVRPPSVA
ncbi:MAG: MFS transporter [Nevskiaceae bacterium]|nr:MAG: MFS transporter [Nevskiaceae bacterium]TBR72084.1 MAG: MFS transporter [Nevskiaceae bacterium]